MSTKTAVKTFRETILKARPAIPAMPVPRGEPDETWTDDALNEYGQSELAESSSLARKSVRARFRAGHAYSILHQRHREAGTWTAYQTGNNLPRTKVWETITVYDRATAAGHGEDDVATAARSGGCVCQLSPRPCRTKRQGEFRCTDARV